jgi:hypothetical protein
MSKAKKNEKVTKGNGIAGGEEKIEIVVDEVKPKSDKELKKLAAHKVKNEKINSEKVVNKAMDEENKKKREERNVEKKLCEEGKACEWKPKNKSQLKTICIIENGAANGEVLSVADARMVKAESRIQEKIVCPVQAVHYFKTLEERAGKRDTYIILMSAGILLTLAKCPMPVNARAYQIKAKALLKAQTDNTFGYFTPPFSGVTVMGGLIDDLLTAITNFEDEDGTGNIETVNGAIDAVQVQVDALLVFVNGKNRANQLAALEIIAAAKMEPVKVREKGKKADFGIRQGKATGEIILTSLAGSVDGVRVPTTYYWQYGLKVGGVWVWTDLPSTTDQCKTTATGMPTDEIVAFRKSTSSTKGGRSAWCTPITIAPK